MIYHRPHHWVAVAVVIAIAIFAIGELHGQGTGSSAMFEGRPALAGAQGGLGAQAGVPQGGLAVEESQDLNLQPPRAVRESRAQEIAKSEPLPITERLDDIAAAAVMGGPPAPRPRDSSLAKDERSAKKKVAKSAKRTLRQAKHGVSVFDARI